MPIIYKRRFNWTGGLNRIWAKAFYALLFMKTEIEYDIPLDKNSQYILCPNHFSYMDIPAMGLINLNSIFVGKSEMEKIPIFGWMYKKLHITVDRESMKSKYSTFVRSIEAVNDGKNLVIFPEGGIISKNVPEMGRFKDGPFRVAVNTQIPIVPVSIINNWMILPPDLLMRRKVQKIRVHSPITTSGKSDSDIPEMKKQVWNTINTTVNSKT